MSSVVTITRDHARSGASTPCRRVLFVANSWPDEHRPWYGIAMRNQAESLRRIGVEIDVLAIRGYAARSAYLTAAARAAVVAQRRRYDLVHAHYGHSGVVGRLQLSAPLVVTYLGSDLLGVDPQLNGLNRRAQLEAGVFRQLARATAATITQSEEMERVLPRSCRARNHVIPEGIDLERFRRSDRLLARQALGWPARERTVLFVADPRRREKNYELAAAVCRRLADEMPDLRLRVVTGVSPDSIPLYMSAADALLLTSHSEGGPSVVKEAMALELPVVSTPVGLLRECLSGLPGLWVRPPLVQALTPALAEALRGGRCPAAREAIGSLSLERVAHRIAGVYDAVASASRRRPRVCLPGREAGSDVRRPGPPRRDARYDGGE